MMKMLTRLLQMARLPFMRARAMRDDDQAQVLVLTAVMVFVVCIMGVTTYNAGTLMYNRVRAQNAVDAAADSFAAYQARGLNFAQHLNDIHYDVNYAIFTAESVIWGLRIACPLASIRPPPMFFDYSFYRTCCATLTHTPGDAIDGVQELVAEVILGMQAALNVLMPVLGYLSANGLAEANGADPVVGWFGNVLGQLTSMFGADASGIEDAFDAMADMPVIGDIYLIPLKFDQVASLNIAENDEDLDIPWDTEGVIAALVAASDIACIATGNVATDDDLGWRDDTFYCGGPSYNTFLVGMKRHEALPGMERIAWLNPQMHAPEQELDMFTTQDDYGIFDHRRSSASTTLFRNTSFFCFASSHVEGSALMERSGHSNFQSYATPHLISVHVEEPGDNSKLIPMMIWH